MISSAIGSLQKVVLHRVIGTGREPEDEFVTLEKPMELASLQGIVLDGKAHFHMVVSDVENACNLRRASATDALTSGRLAEQNGRPPDNPNSVLQLDHHDIMLGDPLEDCVSRYCIVHDHGLPFVWFPLGTDDRAP